ncbi:MAG: NUDIX hydrolase [Robiginitomaculum sp.]|nr:NUDIX hydrolase [Robiginitomaculum sp.]MDQ7077407.1 NUDIX hydrolase [Robiginitomaculum sp.]
MSKSSEFKRDTDPADTPRTGRAVRPKLSATLILLRGDPQNPQVLMGKRAAGHGFMPSKTVFPGGKAERSDAFAPVARPLPRPTEQVLARHLPPRRALAAGAAAIRETFEETGLLLARPLDKPHKGKGPKGWEGFTARNLGADMGALSLTGRAITPPYHPKRFDAWFFMARADDLIDLPECVASSELEDLAWYSLPQTKALDLPTITSIILDEVQKRLTDPSRPIPFYSMRNGNHQRHWL